MKFIENYFTEMPLGMNFRNYLIGYFNAREPMIVAKDKLMTKTLLQNGGVAVPRTYFTITSRDDFRLLEKLPKTFVVKPSRGSGGNGILVLERQGDKFFDPAGSEYTAKNLKRHVRKILAGEFSGFTEEDVVIIEERLYPSPRIVFKSAAGLPDIRIFCINHVPAMSMLRYATKETNGRANLAMGAIGIAIDIQTGAFKTVHQKKEVRPLTLDDLGIEDGFIMPKWEEMKNTAIRASRLSDLKIAGIDLILDSHERVMVLENNCRPGIEIQNINEKSLVNALIHLNQARRFC